ncbi:hypothetical protein [Prescottella agglutinans]|uniref:Phage terminase small subunit P27 family n=1 Tax=Prescottella agglutinans TaxID=1644129 RepID=A0ABT6MG44_9NOCA|nr:hypothetical protein [Prescottella agglutinans]MDH6283288.1 hypothetical protein [Prescottella agglutinans]
MAGRPKTRARKAAQEAGELTPAPVQSWQRPPFEKGHTLSMRHGAHSERKIAPIAAQWVDTALAQCAYLNDPSYMPALTAWARFEAKVDLLHDWLDEHGLIDDGGQATAAAKLLPVYEGRAASLRATLGMDPVARAKLQRDAAATQVDLAALMAQEDDE